MALKKETWEFFTQSHESTLRSRGVIMRVIPFLFFISLHVYVCMSVRQRTRVYERRCFENKREGKMQHRSAVHRLMRWAHAFPRLLCASRPRHIVESRFLLKFKPIINLVSVDSNRAIVRFVVAARLRLAFVSFSRRRVFSQSSLSLFLSYEQGRQADKDMVYYIVSK